MILTVSICDVVPGDFFTMRRTCTTVLTVSICGPVPRDVFSMGVGTGTAGCSVVREHVSCFCSSGCLCAWLSLHALQRFARARLPFWFFLLSVCRVVTACSPAFCESKSPVFVLLVVCVHGCHCVLSSVLLEHVAFLLLMLSRCKTFLYLCPTKFMPHSVFCSTTICRHKDPNLTLITTLALNLSPNPNSNITSGTKQVKKLTVLSSLSRVAAP